MEFFAFRLLLFVTLTLSASGATFARMKAGEVVAVTDGDTISIRVSALQYKIRLNGIDAPETNQEFGQESKRHLSDLVLGKLVVVVWDKTDRYDRILGTVTLGSIDIGLELLRAGLAWYFHPDDSNVPEVERALYLAAETSAKAQSLGLWSQSNPIAPWDWRDRKEPPVTDQPSAKPVPPLSNNGTILPSSTGESRRAYSVQCSATTKRGTRCRRMTLSPNGRCWQHGGN